MGVLEDSLYAKHEPYSQEDTLGKRIIREGKFISRDLYKYKGNHYWVVNGKVLTREQGEQLERERNREKRNQLRNHGEVSTR